jgi:tRNA-dependent cyclodipeptide synthase
VTSDLSFDKKKMPKVGIVKILPRIPQTQLFSHKKCYLGISLENPVFQGDSLKALLAWACEKFEQSLVLVGDYLCRFNEKILSACDDELAADLAIQRGNIFLLQTQEIFDAVPKHKIRLTRWSGHLRTEEFISAKKLLDNLFETNTQFRSSVEYDALSFVERHKKHNLNLAVGMDEAIRLSCEYILEESAVFSSLASTGWEVELYPGSELKILAEVAAGKYDGIPDGLKKRINVELKIGRK